MRAYIINNDVEHRVIYQKGVVGVYLRRKRALLKYIAGENNTFKVADARKPLENGIGGGIIRLAVIRSIKRDFRRGIHAIDKVERNVFVRCIIHNNIIHAQPLQQGIEAINAPIPEQCFQIALVIAEQLGNLYGVKGRVVRIAIMVDD